MGSHQDGASSGSFGRLRFLILVVALGLSSAFLSHAFASHLARKGHAVRLEELANLIDAHRGQLEVRDVNVRSLESAFDSLVGSIESGAKQAAGSLLPNSTTILNDLVSLVTGGGNTSTIITGLQQPAKSLGVGLSSGALTGMNLTAPKMTDVNTTGLSGLALSLGSGLSSTIFSSSAVQSLFVTDPNEPGGMFGGSTGTVGQAVLALAQGLGGGAVSGLKMGAVTGVAQKTLYNTTGVNGVAGNFGQGLSSTFLSGVQLPSLQSLLASLKTSNTSINFADVGAGVGTGIGQGAVVGLGLQPDSTMNVSGAAGIAQGFTKGLVSSFLTNGTAKKLAASFTASANASASAGADGSSANSSASAGFSLGGINVNNINIAKVAEGFAVGLVSGAGSTFTSLNIVSADTTNFDDSVQGASTGFGRGLGSEGGKIVQMVLNKSKATPATDMTGIAARAADPSLDPVMTAKKRSTKTLGSIKNYKGTKAIALQPRGITLPSGLPNATDIAGVLNNLNSTAINPIIQYGIDKLTCTGIGGLAGVFVGLINSGTIPIKLTDLAKNMAGSGFKIGGENVTLPDQTFILKNEGNTYMLNPAQGVMTIMVNGLGLNKVIALAVVHVLFAIIIYVIALPSLLLIRSNDTFAAIASQKPKPPVKRWQLLAAYSMIPVTLVMFGTGIALRGNAKQFGTSHGILGIITVILTLLAGITYPLALNSPSPKVMLAHKGNILVMLTLSTPTIFAGITDVSSLALCAINSVITPSVWVAIGSFLTMQLAIAQGVEGLKLYLWWQARKARKASRSEGDEGKRLKIEKVDYVDVQERSSFKV